MFGCLLDLRPAWATLSNRDRLDLARELLSPAPGYLPTFPSLHLIMHTLCSSLPKSLLNVAPSSPTFIPF